MAVEIDYRDGVLRVDGVRVQRGWGFTRKGGRTRHVIYRVDRWGRQDVTVRRDAAPMASRRYLRDTDGYQTRGGPFYSSFVMPREEFVRFVHEFYGESMEFGEERRRLRAQQESARAQQAVRDAAHAEISDTLDQIRGALDSDQGIYAVVDLLLAVRAEGYAEGREQCDDYDYDPYY